MSERGGQLLAVYETGASCYKSISDFVDAFYLGALGRAYNSSSDPGWKTILTQAQAQGQGQLIAAAQSLGNSVFTSTEFNNHLPDTAGNRGPFVTALYAAYLGRVPDGYGYQAWLNALNTGSSREDVRNGFAYSAEFQNDVGQLCVTMNSSGIKYVMSDVQGTTRAVINNNGASSTIVSRHDYLPFGEEIWSGTGLRTAGHHELISKHILRDGLKALPRLIEIMNEYDPSVANGKTGHKGERFDAMWMLLSDLDNRVVRLRASPEGVQAIDALARAIDRMRAAGYGKKGQHEWAEHGRFDSAVDALEDAKATNRTDDAINDTLWVKYKLKISRSGLLAFSNFLIARDPSYPTWSEKDFIKDYSRLNKAGNPAQVYVMKTPERFYQAYLAFKKQKASN